MSGRRRLRAALLAGAFALGVAPASADMARPKALEGVAFDQRLDALVPTDLRFRDESGAAVRLGDLVEGKPTVLTFAYFECPMLCPLVLSGLAGSLKTLAWNVGEEFRVVTVSIDPTETPALAAAAGKKHRKLYGRSGAERGWSFFTGDEPSIRALTDAVGFRYAYDSKRDQFAHASGVVVLTPGGRVSRYLYGVEFAPRDLRLALVEAADGKIGSLTDQLLLFCFHWDPATGTYGAVAMGAVRVAGALTLFGLGGFLVAMWRRERQ